MERTRRISTFVIHCNFLCQISRRIGLTDYESGEWNGFIAIALDSVVELSPQKRDDLRGALIKNKRLIQIKDRRGNCQYNGSMNQFFRRLKSKWISSMGYVIFEEAR